MGNSLIPKKINAPLSSATKKAIPMPTGAMCVDRCFSAASMMITNTSSAVRNISMKRPCAALVPGLSDVPTFSGPGKRPDTAPAAASPPRSCAAATSTARRSGMPPTRYSARETLGVGLLFSH